MFSSCSKKIDSQTRAELALASENANKLVLQKLAEGGDKEGVNDYREYRKSKFPTSYLIDTEVYSVYLVNNSHFEELSELSPSLFFDLKLGEIIIVDRS